MTTTDDTESTFRGTPFLGVYAATKAALERISEVQYMEARPFNVHVMHVSAGMVQSNMNATAQSQIILASGSMYTGWLEAMFNLMRGEGIPTDDFAQRVVAAVLERKDRHLILGKMSTVAWICQYLPRTWLLQRMWDAVAGVPKPKSE